jgi:hypothetical protein
LREGLTSPIHTPRRVPPQRGPTSCPAAPTIPHRPDPKRHHRLSLRFSDGSELAVHYHVLPPLPQQIAALGRHWAEEAWLPRDYPDPFGRSASVMPWDREDGRHILQVSGGRVAHQPAPGGAEGREHSVRFAHYSVLASPRPSQTCTRWGRET